MSLEEAVWEKVDRSGGDEACWPWLGEINHKGYGRMWVDQAHRVVAHRLTYRYAVGEIPKGLTLDHLCRNRSCVNPKHLEPVTMRENLLRGDTLPARELARSVCPRGHDLDGHRRDRGRRVRYCLTCERERWHRRKAAVLDAEAK